MLALAASDLLVGYFNLGTGEIVLILALVLILYGAKSLPGMGKGLGRGIKEFRDAADDMASDAGQNLGGIYGKRAGQALTPDNQVAELYNRSAFNREKNPRWRSRIQAWLSPFIAGCP